jgi:hypothetical protein
LQRITQLLLELLGLRSLLYCHRVSLGSRDDQSRQSEKPSGTQVVIIDESRNFRLQVAMRLHPGPRPV